MFRSIDILPIPFRFHTLSVCSWCLIMRFNKNFFTIFILLMLCINIQPAKSQACQKFCGSVPIKYPFGTGPGCGDPRFQKYVTCNNQQELTFSTKSGQYPITAINYVNQTMFISDPSMSTCSCSNPTKGFSLDWDAPFSFDDDTVFALLDCDTTSSPVYKSGPYGRCDFQGNNVCRFLSSCQSASRVEVPVSSCCVYTPVDLGPSFSMDLDNLKCGSYSGMYGIRGLEDNPGAWKYGIALKYKFSFDNDYPQVCADCEKSNGACGYGGYYGTYLCNCPNGLNTSSDCFFGSNWRSGSSRSSSGIFPIGVLPGIVALLAIL